MRVFWEQGYEGASLADLINAMGITKTSMYAAFGNKDQLFRKALQRYADNCAEAGELIAARSTLGRATLAASDSGLVVLLGRHTGLTVL